MDGRHRVARPRC